VRQSYLHTSSRARFPAPATFLDSSTRRRAGPTTSRRRTNLTLCALEGFTSLDRHRNLASLAINALINACYHYTLGSLGWRSLPTPKLMIVNHLAWMREKFGN
jgi:hypothetical protein